MRRVSYLVALKSVPCFLEKHTESLVNFRDLGSAVLSGMCIFTWTEKRPGVMSAWYDWKESVQKILEKESRGSITPYNDLFITWEQAFIAAYFFLDEYYWENNNHIKVEEVVLDINNYLKSEEILFKSQIWKEWLISVKKSLEYDFEYN